MTLDELAIWLKANNVRCEVQAHKSLWACTLVGQNHMQAVTQFATTLKSAIEFTVEQWEARNAPKT